MMIVELPRHLWRAACDVIHSSAGPNLAMADWSELQIEPWRIWREWRESECHRKGRPN